MNSPSENMTRLSEAPCLRQERAGSKSQRRKTSIEPFPVVIYLLRSGGIGGGAVGGAAAEGGQRLEGASTAGLGSGRDRRHGAASTRREERGDSTHRQGNLNEIHGI